jgi:lipopolysaccharide transport system ATP-binding protein
MGEVIIKVENISKLYRLGEVGTGTISHDLNRWWARVRGKEDPFAKLGESNDRSVKGNSEYAWALRDIDFEVRQGDVLGIIGRNGAGKSTLLKILSRTTTPTTGEIKIKGRVASLLEVGTGFHPELTGRENIFLNGAILGMTRPEIRRKFDEIVDFAGVERYVDTPVKRYSSGMYVRLAFAVAAHLEPEILIVDEVLAVGDSEFQRKCIGKMKDVSEREGRTVLFVSHNMESMASLCTKGLLLKNGNVFANGGINDIISTYLDNYSGIALGKTFPIESAPGNDFGKLLSIKVFSPGNDSGMFEINRDIFVEIKYFDSNHFNRNTAIIHLKDQKGNVLFASNEFNSPDWEANHPLGATGFITTVCRIPGNFLTEGNFTITAALGCYSPNVIHALLEDVLSFTIVDSLEGVTVKKMASSNNWPGLVRPLLDWSIMREENAEV